MTYRCGLVLAVFLAATQARAETTFQQGLQLKKDGKFPEAEAVFEGIASDAPRNADALEQLATLKGWQGKYDEAVTTWNKALALAPKNLDFRLGLARVLYWEKDNQASLREIRSVLKARPKDFEAWVLLGDVLAASGQAPEARRAYLRAQAISPDEPELSKKISRLQAKP